MTMYTPETKALLEELRPPVTDYAADLALIDSLTVSAADPEAALKIARYSAARADIAQYTSEPVVAQEEVQTPMGEELVSAPTEEQTYQG